MARTLLDFAKSLEARAASLNKIGHEASIRKAKAIISYLIRVTPIDTTRALSNWQVTLNTPAMAPRGAFFVGTHGSTFDASADTLTYFADAVLADKKPGDTIYISNVLRYITYLDQGTSMQFPGGFAAGAQLIARTTK